jgi:CheY-like chemotaxis protein
MVFQKRSSWPRLDHAEIVRRSKILVIDDSEFPYMRLFRRDGYTVEKWNDVKELSQLETGEFDLILLDLYGVGARQSSDQGFGILEHIRKTNPAQLVIAYSNADWSLQYQPFFDNADAVLHKTKADYTEFKRTVDALLDKRFSFDFYVERATLVLGDQASAAPKLKKRLARSVSSGSVAGLRGYLAARVDDPATLDRAIQVAQVAIGIAQFGWVAVG